MMPDRIIRDTIHSAAELLRAGGTVAFPTETVYGLGADATNPLALRAVFEIKGRPADHPLIVHIADASHLPEWAQDIPDGAWRLAAAFWPGPLTLILRRCDPVLNEITGGQDTVGLRVPNHAVATDLLRVFGRAIAAPSANRFGRVSPTTAQHVRDELGARVGMILDGGPCQVGVESTIVSLAYGQATLLRPGGIPVAAIEDVLQQKLALTQTTGREVRVPGALATHYAPATPFELHPSDALWHRAGQLTAQGRKVAVLTLGRVGDCIASSGFAYVPMPSLADEYAHVLYATLHRLDQAGFDHLLAEAPPDTGPWFTVRDRLGRAARGA